MTEKERQEIKSRGFEDLTNITEKELNSLNVFDQIEIYIKSFRNINYVFDKDKKLLYAELYDVYCNIGTDYTSIVFFDNKLINSEYGSIYTRFASSDIYGHFYDDNCLEIPENSVVNDIDLYDFFKNTILKIINNSTNIKKQEIDIKTAINRVKCLKQKCQHISKK